MIPFISSLSAVLGLAKSVKDGTDGILDGKRKTNNRLRLMTSDGNMANIVNETVLEPVIVHTTNSTKSEIIEAAESMAVDVFAVYVTRTFKMLYEVHDLKVSEVYRLISSQRHATIGEAVGTLATIVREDDTILDPTLEADKSKVDGLVKKIELKLKTGKKKDLTIDLHVAAIRKVVPFPEVAELLVEKMRKSGLAYWLREYRSGGVNLMSLIAGDKMAEDYKKRRLKSEGLDEIINKRVSEANRQMAYDAGIGFSKYYQIVILTDKEATSIESAVGVTLDKDHAKVLEALKSFAVVVVNDDYEVVDFYINGLRGKIERSYSSLRKKNDDQNLATIAKLVTNQY